MLLGGERDLMLLILQRVGPFCVYLVFVIRKK